MSTLSSPEGVQIRGLRVTYGDVVAVDGADLEAGHGEVIALLGPSGCGKTTLLRSVAGFEPSAGGEVWVDGELLEGPGKHVPAHQRPVGLVFQDYALFPHKTVAANITYGLRRDQGKRERLRELLHLGGLEGLEGRYPHQLSGGQQQRVAVLRSLAPRPKLLLLDEPFSNLDPALRHEMRSQVGALLRAEGVTAILVTHDRADALAVADRVAVMEAGRILQCATPEDLYFRPASPEVARFGGEVQFLDGTVSGGTVETALGVARAAGPVTEGPCRALVRPEWVVLCQGGSSGAIGRIDERRFDGNMTRFTVALQGGTTLQAMAASGFQLHDDEMHPVGVSVALPTFDPP